MLKMIALTNWKASLVHLSLIFTFGLFFCQSACTPGPLSAAENSITPSPAARALASPAPDVLRYAVFPAPPYMIGADDDASSLGGIDVEIMQEIARRMQLKVEFIKCTWARCLELMQSGEADLLSSAYKKPEREAYMAYFDQPYLDQLPIAFYTLKSRHYLVQKYEDIYQFNNIGVLHDASYFDLFDQDTRAKKFEVPSQDQLFPMLLAGRIDAMAGYVPTENYRLDTGGYRSQIERSVYIYQEQAPVFMTVSKASHLAARFKELNQVNNQRPDPGIGANGIFCPDAGRPVQHLFNRRPPGGGFKYACPRHFD